MVKIDITDEANIDLDKQKAIDEKLVKQILFSTEQIIEVYDCTRGNKIYTTANFLSPNEHRIIQGNKKLKIMKKVETPDY